MRIRHGLELRALALAGALCLSASAPSLAAVFDLRADVGTVTMPDGRVIQVWGFALGAGPVTVPGPQLVLGPGDTTLTINLTNNLPKPVSIVIPGLVRTSPPLTPAFDGGTPPRVLSFDAEAGASGGTAIYTFSGVRPGTFLYESGRDPAQQVQMGLYGALIARPAAGAGRAYAPASTAFSNEIVMVMSEIDPAFHDAVQNNCYAPNGPTSPTCTSVITSAIDYVPRYFLINGAPYNDPYVPFAGGTAGSTTLIRLINAGLGTHTMTLQGTRMDIIAQDANLLGFARTGRVSEPIAAGQTLDILIRPPVAGKYAFFDRALGVTNAGAFPGGLIAFISVDPVPCQSTLDRRISVGSDDAEQSSTGSVSVTGGDLELVFDGERGHQTVGLRFPNITIPQGAVITNAYIQFQADESQSGTTNLTIQAQDADNALTFAGSTNNVSSRPRVGSVAWTSIAAWTTGQVLPAQQTPDITSLVQAVVSRTLWSPGNALAIIITGTGGSSSSHRTAESFEGLPAAAPLLHVDYLCPAVGLAPNGVIDSLPGSTTITAGQSVNLTGTAVDPGNHTPFSYLWDMGGGTTNRTVEDPGTVAFNTPGTFTMTFSVRNSLNVPDPSPDTRVITVNPAGGGATTLERRVSVSSDDAEQKGSSVDLTSSDLELVVDPSTNQTVGIRFTNITIPQGRTITNAWIRFQVDEVQSEPTNLTLQAQAIDDAPTFTTSSNNISSRTRVGSVAWTNLPTWGTVGANQQTPDIKSLIQAVVNRPGWASGNDLVIIITGTGHRTAESFNGSSSGAPLLHVEY